MTKKKRKPAAGGYNTLRNRLGHFLVGGILVIAGPILSFYLWHSGKDGRASETWPTVKGKITEAKLYETQNIFGERFETKVRYTFEVDGKAYTGDRLKVGGKSSAQAADAEADLKRYDVGARPQVFYDPSDPNRCVLETGAASASLLLLAGGPALLLLGLVLAGLGVLMTLLAKKPDLEPGDEDERPRAKKPKPKADIDEEEAPPPRKRKRSVADEDDAPPRKH